MGTCACIVLVALKLFISLVDLYLYETSSLKLMTTQNTLQLIIVLNGVIKCFHRHFALPYFQNLRHKFHLPGYSPE